MLPFNIIKVLLLIYNIKMEEQKRKYENHTKSMLALFFDLADVRERARARHVNQSSAESEAVPQMDSY